MAGLFEPRVSPGDPEVRPAYAPDAPPEPADAAAPPGPPVAAGPETGRFTLRGWTAGYVGLVAVGGLALVGLIVATLVLVVDDRGSVGSGAAPRPSFNASALPSTSIPVDLTPIDLTPLGRTPDPTVAATGPSAPTTAVTGPGATAPSGAGAGGPVPAGPPSTAVPGSGSSSPVPGRTQQPEPAPTVAPAPTRPTAPADPEPGPQSGLRVGALCEPLGAVGLNPRGRLLVCVSRGNEAPRWRND